MRLTRRRVSALVLVGAALAIGIVAIGSSIDVAQAARTRPTSFTGAAGAVVGLTLGAYFRRRADGTRAALLDALRHALGFGGFIVALFGGAVLIRPWAAQYSVLADNSFGLMVLAFATGMAGAVLWSPPKNPRKAVTLGLILCLVGLIGLAFDTMLEIVWALLAVAGGLSFVAGLLTIGKGGTAEPTESRT